MDSTGAYTIDDLAKVREAITRGELSVQMADRTIVFRSVTDLIAAERFITAALNTRTRQTVGFARKGLTPTGI